MRTTLCKNLNEVRDYIEGTITLYSVYFPDELNQETISNDEANSRAVLTCSHAYITRSLRVFSHYLLKLVVATPLQ